jgi:hypothetical protein
MLFMFLLNSLHYTDFILNIKFGMRGKNFMLKDFWWCITIWFTHQFQVLHGIYGHFATWRYNSILRLKLVFKNNLYIFYWTVHIPINVLTTWQCYLLIEVKVLNSEIMRHVKWLRSWSKTHLLHTSSSMGCWGNRRHWRHTLCTLHSPLHLKMMFWSRRWHNKGPWAVCAGFWS